MNKPRLSDSERTVLEILWEAHPRTSSDLIQRLKPRGWSETTVKTLLARLVKKGFASFEQEGNRYLYFPLLSREQSLAQDRVHLESRWDAPSGFALVAQLVAQTELTDHQIDELKRLLEGKNHGNS